MFDNKGVILVVAAGADEEKLIEAGMDSGAEDVVDEGSSSM